MPVFGDNYRVGIGSGTPSRCRNHTAFWTLEDDLSEELFRRAASKLALTDISSAYAPGLADGFARFLEFTANARAGMQPRTRLRVSMLASFVFGWLNTRLPDFRRRYTDIDIPVDATPTLLISAEAKLI